MPGPGGKLMHAEVMIGESRVMLADVFPGSDTRDPHELGGTAANLHIYHKDVGRLWKQAVAAGARVTMPLDTPLRKASWYASPSIHHTAPGR